MNNNYHKKNSHAYDGSKNVLGFWIYIMSDCILFGTLFAVYSVFSTHIFGGVSGKEIFNLSFVFIETIILLISSFTFGLAMIARNSSVKIVIFWLIITFILGLSFISMEIYEFYHLYSNGYSWSESAFLSSFFALVGTHGLHVIIGLIWIVSIILKINKNGICKISKTKLTCLSLFWHFLDIVCIFVFSIVYLIGAI